MIGKLRAHFKASKISVAGSGSTPPVAISKKVSKSKKEKKKKNPQEASRTSARTKGWA